MEKRFALVEHNPEWKHIYTIEAEKIKQILGSELLKIHHIGSTAIAGLIAKPIIDILVVVKDIKALDVFQNTFEKLGYEWEGEFGITNRRFIKRLEPDKTNKEAITIVHLHCYQQSSPHIIRHLAFRDYLLKHPDTLAQYADLKKELLATDNSREQYQNQKAAFIKAIEQTALVNYFAKQWGLSELKPMDNLSYNYVLSGMQKDTPIILKIVFDTRELQQEINAITYFNGHSCVRILEQDIPNGALLLEKVIPGVTLKSFFPERDTQAVKIASQVIRDLHSIQKSPDPKKFPHLSDWLKIFDKKFDLPTPYVDKAKELGTQLLATTTKNVLLHGDLHHENILSCGPDKWVAIDPKGVIGDPVYEFAPFIMNPWPEILENPDIKNILHNRIVLFTNFFGVDRQRIIDWTYVLCVLTTCWAIEDNWDSLRGLRLADIIEQIKNELK